MPELAGDTSTASSTPSVAASPSAPSGATGASDSASSASTPQGTATSFRERLSQNVSATGSESTPRGPIPYERHEAVLAKARSESDAKLAEWKTQHGWAEGITADQRRQWEDHFTELRDDPFGAGQKFIEYALKTPANQAKLDAWLTAKGYSKGGQPAQAQNPAVDGEPQPDLQHGDYKWYSAEQQAKRDAWLQRQIESSFSKRLAPFEAAEKNRQAEADKARQQQEVTAWSQKHFSAVSKLPHYEANKADIAKVFASMPFQTVEDIAANVRDAYMQVVMPSLTGQARSQVISELDAKAKAGTHTPRSSVSATPAATNDKPDFRTALQRRMTAGG